MARQPTFRPFSVPAGGGLLSPQCPRSDEPGHGQRQVERLGQVGEELHGVSVGRVAGADLGEQPQRLGHPLGRLQDGVAMM